MRSPDFIIPGAMKAGTTVLLSMLSQHPKIKTVALKYGEVHFFDNGPRYKTKGIDWYRGLFDIPGKVTGEKSPRYMANPWAMILMERHCPDTKLIITLRDPVIRFISCRTMSGHTNPKARADSFWRGCYAAQLELIFNLFDRKNIHVLFNEDMREDTEGEIQKIHEFLGLEKAPVKVVKRSRNTGEGERWDPLKERLIPRYRPFNERLIQLLPENEKQISRWLGMKG